VEKDPETGEVVEVRCTYDPETRGGDTPDGRTVKGTIHWVSAEHALPAEVRLYDRLFLTRDPDDVPEGEDFTRNLNPDSMVVVEGAKVEPSVADDDRDLRYQFERTGYFWRDPVDGRADALVFNRIVTLRDTWAKRVEKLKVESGIAVADEVEEKVTRAEAPAPEPRSPEERISDERRAARRRDPELAQRMERYREELGLSLEDADILTGSRVLSDLFEEALSEDGDPGAVAAWIVNELLRELKEREIGPEDLPFHGPALGRLVGLVEEGRINRRAAREVLAEMVAEGADPVAVVEERGLETLDDPEAVGARVDEVLGAHPDEVARFRDGEENLLGFFIGRVMEATGGRADPGLVRTLLRERLEGE